MQRRAFLAVQYQTDVSTVECWGVAEVDYPADIDDIEEAARSIASIKGAPKKASVIVKSMCWIGPATE